MKKYFFVTISTVEEIPYEEGLVDGFPNKNHLMYQAQHQLDKRGFDSSKAIYEYELRVRDENGRLISTRVL